ncbi:GNAT family N-acetyltransferase [Psychrobacter sp. SCQQ22]|uniref:GNAT family N-acetyltransferase n=1 Tax=Psychrobacter sp. SCQQ22 TaxID=2792059 RepID=UPI0018CE274D|nr:GNAT family N-acetyltransferase [Psychrobacter sp. SCQQ22]MBH0086036.1 GNAT family N-acetyltransferase [Psychrobacter sp. SCQQ22]
MTCTFSIKTFDELTSVDLYHILKARSQVFVVEQNCAYQDMDELDFDCLHLIAHQNEALVAYCRIIPPEFNKLRSNLSSSDATTKVSDTSMSSIGRVLVLAAHRGDGLARDMMNHAIAHCRKKYGKKRPIIISAQAYLISFYESLGFVPEGEHYLEDNIEHVKMVLHVVKKVKVKKERTGASSTTSKVLSFLLLIMAALFVLGLLYLMT